MKILTNNNETNERLRFRSTSSNSIRNQSTFENVLTVYEDKLYKNIFTKVTHAYSIDVQALFSNHNFPAHFQLVIAPFRVKCVYTTYAVRPLKKRKKKNRYENLSSMAVLVSESSKLSRTTNVQRKWRLSYVGPALNTICEGLRAVNEKSTTYIKQHRLRFTYSLRTKLNFFTALLLSVKINHQSCKIFQ